MGLNLCDSCRTECRHERNPREIVIKWGAYKPPMTNADRIRAMDDETLAEFLYRYFWGRLANLPNREERLLEWLQQPAEEGSDRDG